MANRLEHVHHNRWHGVRGLTSCGTTIVVHHLNEQMWRRLIIATLLHTATGSDECGQRESGT